LIDYGKPFENCVREALISEQACFDRLPDQMTGRSGSVNPGDFTAYKKPYYYYIEAKSCVQSSFSIKGHIGEGQWLKLLEKTQFKRKGVYAGYLIWFVKEEVVVWVPATNLDSLYKSGVHSPTSADLLSIGSLVEIEAKKDKVIISNLLKTITATKQK